MAVIKLAMIGCGRVASHHANMMRDLPEINLVAVCDLKEDRARALAEANKVPCYLSYHEMIKKENPDVVSIITPSGMHPIHAIDVIQRYRKHVVIEKPIVLALEDSSRLYEVAKSQGVNVYPIYQNRYNKAVQRVKRAITDGELGRIIMGSVRLYWSRPQAYYDRDPWRGTWAMDGGALTNQGVHYIDLLQWLVGDVDEVNARKATQLVNVEVEDTLIGTVRFKSGALGTVEVTTAARPKDYEATITILGDKGSAIISGIATNALVELTTNPSDCATSSEEFPTVYGFGHRLLLQSVALDLAGKVPYPIPYVEALNAVRLLNAFYASSELGQTVKLSDNPRSKFLGQPDQKLINLYTTPAI